MKKEYINPIIVVTIINSKDVFLQESVEFSKNLAGDREESYNNIG